jgi:hypothetical protein
MHYQLQWHQWSLHYQYPQQRQDLSSTYQPAEVGKVTLKSTGDEELNDEFLLKSNGNEALNYVFS